MTQSRKTLIHVLFIMMTVSILAQVAEATSVNFSVDGGGEITKMIGIALEDHVLIRFSVIGTSDKTLYFYITYPNGTVNEFGNVSNFHYSFVCDVEGEYILHFSNLNSTETKHVTLDYEVQHYIFGIPQMLFLTIIIVVVCMMAVAAFILMGKPR